MMVRLNIYTIVDNLQVGMLVPIWPHLVVGASTINLGTSTSDSFVEYELGDSWKAVSVMGESNSRISYINIEFKISYVD